MNAICNHSSAVPEWVTISEAANIINQQPGISVTEAAIWRYALYGHLILSVYFQSPVKMRRIKTIKSNIVLTKVKDDIVGRLCNLSPECLTTDDYWRVKTEGEIISPASYIIDTPLMGHECIALQQRLAFSLSLPPPQTGHCNIHCGITVQRGGSLYQIVENISSVQRITQQLQCLSPGKQEYYREKLNRLHINREQHNYFPVYHFPDDAWFVIKRVHLEQFICIFFAQTEDQKKQIRLSTPVSRLLWLACKHNDSISPLIDHPYKLLSVFEEWALAEGITEHLSGETLKTALKRGAPALL